MDSPFFKYSIFACSSRLINLKVSSFIKLSANFCVSGTSISRYFAILFFRISKANFSFSIVTWSASQVKNLTGSFVKCGVAFGTLSLTLLNYFEQNPSTIQKMYLFDCWEPIRGHNLDMIFPIKTDLTYFDCEK